jgi:transcriptional antiterminator RfaH
MENPLSSSKWYAVHVRSNQERKTADFVSDRRVEVFLPTYRIQSKRRDRRVMLTKSLFSGYLFVRINPQQAEERVQVLKAPGTVRIVSFGKEPVPVPDSVIESIRILVGDGDGPARPHPLVRLGKSVEVVDGPFRGAVGILHETDDKKPKLVVEIEFLGRAVAVPIAMEQVQPLLR